MNSAVTIPPDQHIIAKAQISENALKVLYRLKESGYDAYLVGGSVRDLLLGHEPKDFDIATNALPDQIRALFRNSRLIGRRFRLAHVHFGDDIIEVATFRATATTTSAVERVHAQGGLILRDNVYGTIEEDVWRRDFTVNALYYNIADNSVVDYTGGLNDLNSGILKIIGDPKQRYIEDPVRMLRAIRFMAKLGFRLDPETEKPIFQLQHLLADISPARLFEETIKLFHGGHASVVFSMLRRYGLFSYLFPLTDNVLQPPNQESILKFIHTALENTDSRIREGKSTTPAFLLAVLLWFPLQQNYQTLLEQQSAESQLFDIAIEQTIREQIKSITLPRRFTSMIRDIWKLQFRLESRQGRRAFRLLEHRRFRAAYDFLLMRAEIDIESQALSDWWTHFQSADDATKRIMVSNLNKKPRKRKASK